MLDAELGGDEDAEEEEEDEVELPQEDGIGDYIITVYHNKHDNNSLTTFSRFFVIHDLRFYCLLSLF